LYSSANNHDTSTSILSIREMVAIVVVFAFVLYLLFPQKDINSIIQTQGKNTNLSINYLESMLLYYPNSVKLKMILIANYRRAGKIDKALQLTQELLASPQDRETLQQLYKMEYLLLKSQYFATQNPKLLRLIKKKLLDYFEWSCEPKEYIFFFPEATQIDFPELQLVALKGLMQQRPELIDYKFEKLLFNLASSLGNEEETYASLLRLLDYPEVEKSIKEYAVSFLYAHEAYAQASDIAYDLYLDAQDPQTIRNYFTIILNLLSRAKRLNEETLLELLHTYERRLPLQSSDLQRILKEFLASNDIRGAAAFAIRSFHAYPSLFDPPLSDLAIKSLTYNQRLKDALEIAQHAYQRFGSQKWLDQQIQLALWLGKMQQVITLNIRGYHRYHDPKYETYLLTQTRLEHAHEILGTLYQKHLEAGEIAMLKPLVAYFEYTGMIDQGAHYFRTLLRHHPHPKIHQQAILFSYHNRELAQGIQLYQDYKALYDINQTLQRLSIQKLTALKRHQEAYAWAKELDQPSPTLITMATMAHDYAYLYQLLWRQERTGQLETYYYSQLIQLEKKFNQGEKLAYLYQKAWDKSHDHSYLYGLLYYHLQNKAYDAIAKILDQLPHPSAMEKELPYHLFLATYHAQILEPLQALEDFKHALELDPTNPQTHQAYLWFLIGNTFTPELKQELRLLQKHPNLRQRIGFPSVIAALELQKGDLARRWLTPLLEADPKPEYLTIYADLLEQQDRVPEAHNIRRKLFKRLKAMIHASPKYLKDKHFARLYLPLLFRYETPVERSKVHLNAFKDLLDPILFQEVTVGYHTYHQNIEKLYDLTHREKIDYPWLNLYLAMGYNDNPTKDKLLAQHKARLPVRDRVIASKDIGDRSGAYTLAFEGLQDNEREVELYRIYDGMVNQDYPAYTSAIRVASLSPNVLLQQQHLDYRWHLYRAMNVELVMDHYQYNHHQHDTQLSLTLGTAPAPLDWEIGIEHHQSTLPFTGFSLKGHYQLTPFDLAIHADYQTKSTLTPELHRHGMQDQLTVQLSQHLSQRLQLDLTHQRTHYAWQDHTSLGYRTMEQLRLSYLWHAGYPDMRLIGSLSSYAYTYLKRFQRVIPSSLHNLILEKSVMS